MILKMRYECDFCGHALEELHFVKSDIVKRRIIRLAKRCPNCGHTMVNHPEEHNNQMFQINNDKVMFLGTEFVTLEDNEIRINCNNLMHMGYMGKLNIVMGHKTDSYVVEYNRSPRTFKVKKPTR